MCIYTLFDRVHLHVCVCLGAGCSHPAPDLPSEYHSDVLLRGQELPLSHSKVKEEFLLVHNLTIITFQRLVPQDSGATGALFT